MRGEGALRRKGKFLRGALDRAPTYAGRLEPLNIFLLNMYIFFVFFLLYKPTNPTNCWGFLFLLVI